MSLIPSPLQHAGEKLSKNELKHMTTIKKLRAEKTEVDKTIAEMQKKVDKASGDQVETNGKLAKMMEAEKKLNGGSRGRLNYCIQ